MIIDFHTHTFPGKIVKKALGVLQDHSHTETFSDGTDDGLVRSMRKCGIDRSVLLTVATSAGAVRHINDSSLRKRERRAEQGLIAFGAMHPDFEDCRGELARLKKEGFRGIKMHPVYQDVDINDIRMIRIYDCCAELGLMVVLHAGLDVGYLEQNRGAPDMTLSALRELRCISSEDNGFRMVLAHMGGWRQWDSVVRLAPQLLEAGPVMLDTAFSASPLPALSDGYWKEEDLPMLDQDGFMRIIRTYGAERILFGTDIPWSDPAKELRFIRALPLSEEEKDMILGGNAAKVLGLFG